MSGNRGEIRRRLQEIIEKFRQKGATSPEKAMTIQELDLPGRFEEAMHRRFGQSGIFVEINGKYYLNEDRLKFRSNVLKEGLEAVEVAVGAERTRRVGPASWGLCLCCQLVSSLPMRCFTSSLLGEGPFRGNSLSFFWSSSSG